MLEKLFDLEVGKTCPGIKKKKKKWKKSWTDLTWGKSAAHCKNVKYINCGKSCRMNQHSLCLGLCSEHCKLSSSSR